eukprot:g7993.t1
MDWISNSITSLFGGSSTSEDGGLQKTGILTKVRTPHSSLPPVRSLQEQLSTFFTAGHKMFDDPSKPLVDSLWWTAKNFPLAVKLRLKEAAAKRQNVDWVITEMQKQIFESQGIDGRFGVSFLGKIRTTYSADAEVMQQLMQFVEHEEMALDEAELTIDEFLKKLELKEWALSQYQTMRQQIKELTPQQQKDFLVQQQLMMKEVSKESEEVLKASENMSSEEKKQFIREQVQRIQARFQLKERPGGDNISCDKNHCQRCEKTKTTGSGGGGGHGPSLNQRGPNLGSSMTPEEQANFFKAMYNARR